MAGMGNPSASSEHPDLDTTNLPHVHFTTKVPDSPVRPNPPATPTQPARLSQILASLQSSGELRTLLQQQPELMQELTALMAGEAGANTSNQSQPGQAAMTTSQPFPMTSQPLRGSQSATPVFKPMDLLQDPSTTSPTSGDQDGVAPTTSATNQSAPPKTFVYKEQDRFLPIHNVSRIMRNSVSKSGKVSKEAKECMQECVSEFISFLTSEACDKCIVEKRKTITGDDILFAMAALGFDNYVAPLRIYLQRYREHASADRLVREPLTNEFSPEPVVATSMSMDTIDVVTATVPTSSTTL